MEAQQYEKLPVTSVEEGEINYWVFGPCPSSCILETRKNNVSERGPFSVLR
jgi:hypothetical protein